MSLMRRTRDEFVFGELFLKIDSMTKTEEDNLISSVVGGEMLRDKWTNGQMGMSFSISLNTLYVCSPISI